VGAFYIACEADLSSSIGVRQPEYKFRAVIAVLRASGTRGLEVTLIAIRRRERGQSTEL